MKYLELRNISKSFGDYMASDNASLGIDKGRLIGLLGPSGSGKTTILRMIAGLETPDSGDIIIDGRRVNDVDAGRRGIGFVFQNYALFRYMTVFDNIAFGLRVKRESRDAIKKRVGELIGLVGLDGLDRRYPHQLSGGQKQRVAFARALAPNPHLLLLDEPFAAIDAKVRQELRRWLRRVIESLRITSIFVTHDQDEAVEVADEIVVINAGRIEQAGSPVEIYKQPATPFVARFIGRSDVLDDAGWLKGFGAAEGFSQAVIRPEFIRVEKSGRLERYVRSIEDGVVEESAFRGNCMELKIRVGSILLTANHPLDKEEIRAGETVSVLIRRIYVFDGNEARILDNANLKENDIYI
ncbi:MAG: sulfate ABC transporter ATP-binding protein [Synergistaceae bacterium]|nr:sulfate ABC transporter ATP-binding protein [Synergistaceae bacterium]